MINQKVQVTSSPARNLTFAVGHMSMESRLRTRCLSVLFFSLITCDALLAQTNAGQDLAIAVSLTRAIYASGETIPLSLVVSNVSARTLLVPNGKAERPCVWVEVRGKAATSFAYVDMTARASPPPPSRSDFSALTPKQSLTIRYQIDPRNWYDVTLGCLATNTGNFMLQLTFSNGEHCFVAKDQAGKFALTEDPSLWEGAIRHADVPITIR